MKIEQLVVELSKDPFNPELNYAVAQEYDRLNQNASAVSFYMRTAEYGEPKHTPLIYQSLINVARCLDEQIDRVATVSNCLLQAIAVMPFRPEAYFFLSQFHERLGHWREAYTFAEIGLTMSDAFKQEPYALAGYYGKYCLEFEKAVSAYWVGRPDESLDLLNKLKDMDIAPEYKAAVLNNLDRLSQ